MNFPDFVNLGVTQAEFQLRLMETALRLLSTGALLTIGSSSAAYFLLWLAEVKNASKTSSR